MKKFGILNKIKNKVIKTYTHTRMKGIKLSSDEVHFELLDSNGDNGLDEQAYVWGGSSVDYNSEYVPFIAEDHLLKIYRYIKDANKKYRLTEVPKGHDYNSGLIDTLYPKRHFNQGELFKVEHFADEEHTDLVIRVNIVYTRDALGFALDRTTTRIWVKENGEDHTDTKVTRKVYKQGTLDPIEEGMRRRGNVIKGLQMPILGMMMATVTALVDESEPTRQGRIVKLGRKFLAENKEAFTMFTEDSNRGIVEDIVESTDFWIDNIIDAEGTRIRDYIIAQLNIGGLS